MTLDATPPASYDAFGQQPFAGCGLGRLMPATLQQVDAAAALQDRVDRKYVLPRELAGELLDRVGGDYHLLRVKGRESTSYRSLYLDLVDWDSVRQQVQGRRHQWKVRYRLYREDGLCRLEVKTKDGRGRTIKQALAVDPSTFGILDDEGAAFVTRALAAGGVQLDVGRLVPGVQIEYTRATLADLTAGSRMTLDAALSASYCGRTVQMSGDVLLVETKGGQRPASADRELLALGVRPEAVSKYGVSIAMLQGVRAPRWLRVARGNFRVLGPDHLPRQRLAPSF